MEVPKVTVCVLTYKRPEGVRKTLESALMQDYPNLEVIVVDNGSGAGVPESIQNAYPRAKVIGLPTNLGTCEGRNQGVRQAEGEIVVTLDDDVYFDSKDAVQKIVEDFRSRPEVGCLTFKVFYPSIGGLGIRDWCHPRDPYEYSEEAFYTDGIAEGASAFRREVFLKVGGYYSRLFYGLEGQELTLRLWNKGYKVLYTPQVLVWHTHSMEGREDGRSFYLYPRNYMWIAFRNYGYLACSRFLLRRLGSMLFHSIRYGQLKPFLRGVVDGIRGGPEVFKDREPISRETELLLQEVRTLEPGLLYLIKKHWHKSQV